MPKFTMREYALGLGLKLTKKKHLRKPKPGDLCMNCMRPVNDIMYVTFGYKPLYKPIVTPNYTITQVPYVIHKFCIPCARHEFPGDFKNV